MTKEEILAALNAERYSTGQWFKTPEPRTVPVPTDPALDDSELTTARRRRDLLAAADTKNRRTA